MHRFLLGTVCISVLMLFRAPSGALFTQATEHSEPLAEAILNVCRGGNPNLWGNINNRTDCSENFNLHNEFVPDFLCPGFAGDGCVTCKDATQMLAYPFQVISNVQIDGTRDCTQLTKWEGTCDAACIDLDGPFGPCVDSVQLTSFQ